MPSNQDQINKLLEKLDILLKRQASFSREVSKLQEEIYRLKKSEITEAVDKTETPGDHTIVESDFVPEKEIVDIDISEKPQPTKKEPKFSSSKLDTTSKDNSDIEKFIGENLINKIGIAITVIGVAIGAKYSIEHDLISPLTRIILGYLAGLALLGVGMKLKKNYENYSAVLVAGAMAILYFITYSAYSFYDLIPQSFAFALMVVFTAFTVVAAISYDKQVIAHIGLVGAYAVPFFLSEGSGRVDILFSYMAIINVGILAIAFKKYWKPLYYSSFLLTWLLYFVWYVPEYQTEQHFALALTFLAVFFIIFYLTFLAYKLVQKEKFELEDILLLLVNSFIFYGVGYLILNDHKTGEQFLGLFTLGNAIIHFIVSAFIYRQKLADRNLFYFISGLVLVFITIAFPVQLDGHWVTLFWVGEAALLFWIGRARNAHLYEKLSYALMLLAFFSILHDWTTVYNNYDPDYPETKILPLLNINFLTSVLFIAAFGFINRLNCNKKYETSLIDKNEFFKIVSFIIPAIFLFITYNAFIMEITAYWDQRFLDSTVTIKQGMPQYPVQYQNYDLPGFKNIWLINYSILFLSLLSVLNIKKLKNRSLGLINMGLNTFAIAAFLITGLYELSKLQATYLAPAEYFQSGIFNVIIRYISLVLVVVLLVVSYKYIRRDFMKTNLKVTYDLLLHLAILWMASSELIYWMDAADSTQSYKLGLSILWGIYALLLIGLGLWKKKKHLRIGAIFVLAITLIKLFFYDISHLNTISKTIVFVSLGVLLLIISFLYNKYKNNIYDEDED